MIIRIVKLTIRSEEIANFQDLFTGWEPRIRSFPGCRYLALLHDVNDPRVFFTYSHWDGPDDLEGYRNSELFARVWPRTKALFAAPPEAWTVERERELP